MMMWGEQCCSKYFACGAVLTALFICTFYVFLTPPNQVWLAPPIARLTPEFDNVQSKCSVILEKNGSNIPRENRVCSLRNFQVAMDTNGYFPDHGRWQFPSNGFPQLSYIPDYCYFDRDTPLSISKCFSERRWRRILTMGDSIGKRHSVALVSTLRVYGYECKLLRAERIQPLVGDGHPPDVNYFLKIFPDIRLKTKPRSCGTCGGRLTRCINGNSTVEIEHLGLTHLEDRSLQLPPAYTTTLQFYFKNDIYSHSFPLTTSRSKYKERLPWLSRDLREIIKQKNKWFKKCKRNPTVFNKETYHSMENDVMRLMRSKEKEYYHELFERFKKDSKRSWSIIRELVRSKSTSSASDKFNINDACEDRHENCGANPGWPYYWCDRDYVRDNCPVLCGLCEAGTSECKQTTTPSTETQATTTKIQATTNAKISTQKGIHFETPTQKEVSSQSPQQSTTSPASTPIY
ncbi:hypothetical protein CAPTEDRAFT_199026 [Capitella teleta]|uniref:ShKT domain-containing protein n=1 Tax=Capitella teleta TaxID=283909 RepID=R7TYF2_CAPTE|nr:hypothetical protein CAPTEDRAFT_199026 [Capitella teleta]|eukprot:ELT95995.1 hypothetical protein CAPTEDRAFT_199026 [Capitella teleta]